MADPLISPSTITAWLDCDFYLSIKLGGSQADQNHPNAFAQLLMEKGLAHEKACLADFESRGLSIFSTPERADDETFAQWVHRVGNPMEEGWDVIYQYPMIHDGLRGIADFLVRVPEPVDGKSTYEPYDAKLARLAAKPGHVLQLCFYADAIEALTGLAPHKIHLWLGSGEIESLEVDQFSPYWRRLRRRLATAISDPQGSDPRPQKCSHCEFCEYSENCQDTWRAADSLEFVAGIRKKEKEAFEEVDVTTVLQLAEVAGPTPLVAPPRQDRLRQQAKLQVISRSAPDDPPAFLPVPPGEDPVWGYGYTNLPEPDVGDVYFDLEGHPFWTPSSGLFFLFGLWYQVNGEWIYDARWAHDLGAQDETAARVVEFFDERRQIHPGFHVYHYNHTERTSMAAMTLGHPSEALFTHLSDTGLFVDLMKVATNSFQVGVESYGLKSLESLAGYQREGDIEGGAGAVVDYDRYMNGGDPALLAAIAQYNGDDVRATQALHGWLLDHRPVDAVWREPVLAGYAEDPELDLLVQQLLASDVGTPEHLLGDLLGYWRRERSADVVPKFARLESDTHELLEDPDVVADLSLVGLEEHQGQQGNLTYAVFSWPDQPLANDLKSGTVLITGGPGESDFARLVTIDRDLHTVTLRWDENRVESGYLPRALSPDDWINPDPKPVVLGEFARQVLAIPGAGQPNPVTMALLERALPRFLPGTGPPDGLFQDDGVESILEWVADLDSSFVAVQGPPGTGKTYRGAHIIHALIASGKRVGISAFGHAAIDNLLTAVHSLFEEKGQLEQLSACKKISNKSQAGSLKGFKYSTNNAAAANAKYNLVAGTSWFFASPQMSAAPVDVLVIDEAGQLALADAVVASRSARNVILLGDPSQLAQVSKATHPDGAGASVLEHVLDEDVTIAADRGLFLAESRRMHPAICGFISSQFYEGRLKSHVDCSVRNIDGVDPGLVWIEAHHEGRSTESPEEAALVADAILALLGREWTNASGERSPITAADFMVVAPYNDQVHLVRGALAQDDRTATVKVGTVDKFQGGEAPVVFFTMATSTGDDMPRGPDFLFSRNRLNVAVSRAQFLACVVCNEDLLDSRARTVQAMRLIGTTGAFVESARAGIWA